MQIGPYGLVFKRKIQKNKGRFAWKLKNTKMAAILE